MTSFAQYTLQDADVTISDGIIQECTYSGGDTYIIIPDQLYGQTVTGIADEYSNDGVFANMGIIQVDLPSGMQNIGEYAFWGNSIETVNFSNCPGLETIGLGAFHSNNFTEVDLSGNANLISIGSTAFFTQQGDGLTSVDLSGCTSLEIIESSAFSANQIESLNLGSCPSLVEIGIGAFSNNQLTVLNLSGCTSLLKIGGYAFNNNSLSGFSLPVNTQYSSFGWVDANENQYDGGDFVSDFIVEYWVPVTYTIQDADVTIVDGVITEFIYDYTETSITIPETLQGQTVIGIADDNTEGVFEANGITEVFFPSTLQFIGNRAFYGNDIVALNMDDCTQFERFGKKSFEGNDITEFPVCPESLILIDDYAFRGNKLNDIDLSGYEELERIGDYAFELNFDGYYGALDLSGCISLEEIGVGAFFQAYLNSVDFSECESLRTIENTAFYQNYLTEVDLSSLTALEVIDVNAFAWNSITNVDISTCESLYKIGYWAFDNNFGLSQIQLPAEPSTYYYFWRDNNDITYSGEDIINDLTLSYEMPVYVLSDEDVVVTNGYITECLVDFPIGRTYLVFPDILDDQPLWGIADGDYIVGNSYGIFEDKDIERVYMPSTIKKIGDYAFKGNVITNLPLGGYADLLQIGVEAFADNLITIMDFNAYSLTVIDEYAFYNNQLTDVDLNNASALKVIGDYAFVSNSISTLTLNNADQLQHIGEYAFAINSIVNFVLPTPDISGYNFNNWTGTNSSTYAGGATASNLNIGYNADLSAIGHSLTFTVTDGVLPIESAYVTLETFGTRLTNEFGEVVFESVEDYELNYNVCAFNYDDKSGSITMSGVNNFEDVVLAPSAYDVVFNLYDGLSPAGTSNINFDGVDYSVGTGHLVIEDVSPGTYVYTVTSDFYSEVSSTLDVVAVDVEETVHLDRVYSVNFTITDGTNPIEGANINFDGLDYFTNATGLVSVLDLTEGSFDYSVSADGYNTFSSSVTISDDDINLEVALDAVYTLTFNVTDGMNPIANADVTFNGSDYTCDGFGHLVLEDLVAGTYDYIVTSTDYSVVNSSVTLDSDETLNIVLELVYDIEFYVSDGTLPIENASIDFNDEVLTTNIAGFVTFNNVPAGIHTYIVSADGYQNSSGMLTVDDDLTETVTLISVGVDQFISQRISVYPNPTSGQLNFAGVESNARVEIFNQTGQLVVEFMTDDDFMFDISDYPAGVYTIRYCPDSSNMVVKRIIKE